eukprot:TRINITY_DN10171_c0_g1_i1.p1 TRINITY_DN10171_c0_g1~~TRINITY_DN10171_c0_g1_i1.p1  ORF type:complete len:339 (-),score=-5.15 TRINITY_DN10171_c0_g1_i1:83-1099(-)
MATTKINTTFPALGRAPRAVMVSGTRSSTRGRSPVQRGFADASKLHAYTTAQSRRGYAPPNYVTSVSGEAISPQVPPSSFRTASPSRPLSPAGEAQLGYRSPSPAPQRAASPARMRSASPAVVAVPQSNHIPVYTVPQYTPFSPVAVQAYRAASPTPLRYANEGAKTTTYPLRGVSPRLRPASPQVARPRQMPEDALMAHAFGSQVHQVYSTPQFADAARGHSGHASSAATPAWSMHMGVEPQHTPHSCDHFAAKPPSSRSSSPLVRHLPPSGLSPNAARPPPSPQRMAPELVAPLEMNGPISWTNPYPQYSQYAVQTQPHSELLPEANFFSFPMKSS